MSTFTAEKLLPYISVIIESAGNANEAQGIWWIGYSGGLDSTVLLHALAQLELPSIVQALHINHQISPNADAWQEHCANFCDRLNIKFFAEKVRVITAGKGIEDAARNARYQVFTSYVGERDYLFTAHHSNDQTETLMLRLMRGTGPRGLAAIASSRELPSGGRLIRPLLHFSRTELEDYARTHGLRWVDDESNQDDRYDRNFLRNQVMPLLHTRWPTFTRKWQQTADLCAQQESLLDEFAQEDLQRADVRDERVGKSVDLTWLMSLSRARRQHVLRYWLRKLNCDMPEAAHWAQLEEQLSHARADASVQISWGGLAFRPYRGRLFLVPTTLPELELQLVALTAAEHGDQTHLRADLPNLRICFRSGGERSKPVGRQHSQTLKKLLQEYSLEPWLRDAVPLLYSGDDLVAVGDLWVNDGFTAAAGAPAFKLAWKTAPVATIYG